MSQKNIDFGSFPNDPAADPIRAAFQKVQDNFTDLYSTVLSTGVTSVDVGAGLLQNRNTGEVTLTAKISSVTINTDTNLYVGITPSPTTYTATITNYNTPFKIALAPSISTGNATLTGLTTTSNLSVGNYVTTSLVPSSNIALDLGSSTHRWRDLFLSGNSLSIGSATITTTGNTVVMPSVLVSGNVNAGSVTATYVAGTLTSPSQPNITTVGILNGLSVSGDISGGNLTLVGNVAAANMAVTGVFSAPTIVGNVVTPAGGAVAAPGSSSQLLFNDGGNTNAISSVTYNSSTNLLSIAGNMSGGNITTTGSMTGASLSVTGNASVGNIGTSRLIASGNIESANVITVGILASGNVAGGNISTNGILSVTGNASAGNISTSGFLTVSENASISGTITATNAALGNLVSANYFTGVITTGSQPNVTSLGTIINLSMAGTGGITGGNLVSANYFTGVVTTASQPNITSLGNLSSLNVVGNVVTGNVSGSIFTATYYVGDGANITNLSAANIVGVVANASFATTADSATTAGSATIAGTITGNSQPNITSAVNLTSIGTLSALTVSGTFNSSAISASDNVSTTSYFLNSVNNSVAAAGIIQSTATLLAKQINVISSATPSVSDGVRLPGASAGMSITIINNTAYTVKIYPATGATIESLATNASYSLGSGGRLQFIATTPIQWYALTSVYA